LALLDWEMPGRDGTEICRGLRSRRHDVYTYVIMLSARDGRDDVVAGLSAGADDYITKPYDPSELRVRLRAGRRIMDLQSQLIAARDAMRERATHDSLTGLWNRASIVEVLTGEINRAGRSGRRLAAGIADLDHFKAVNDTHGHLAGDAVLRVAAERFARSVRSYDRVGRYGGEEFLFVFPDSDAELSRSLGERLRSAVASEPMDTSEGWIAVTTSIGIAVAKRSGTEAVDLLLRRADEALYRAKRDGRNRVVVDVGDE
jgi:diguanylate cyclase (GGDEF)-like protein